ncbi:YdaS family helix-turn-helix protein [Devosia sp. LC5]|uniref:YdaS family helix-turn-helix protein n=1 Tax=Devosia sp. LC5 TaxID=1502724 RepID=UPI0005581032|nr:YdaS family helix-turn-helix protein [Devosia sp. LC5]
MQLEAYIKQHTTVTEFAKQLKKSRQQVHRYMRGEHLTLSIIDRIEAETRGQVTAADLRASRSEAAA